MVDLFDEVEEQLRSERYKNLALKFAPFAVIAVMPASCPLNVAARSV